jgi:hypothetical protein
LDVVASVVAGYGTETLIAAKALPVAVKDDARVVLVFAMLFDAVHVASEEVVRFRVGVQQAPHVACGPAALLETAEHIPAARLPAPGVVTHAV